MPTSSNPANTTVAQSVSDIVPVDESVCTTEITMNNAVNERLTFKTPRAPLHVYSCFVVNKTAQPIECTLKYNGRPGEDKFDEVVNVTIFGDSEHYFPRQFFHPDLPKSYCKWVKIITHVQVKKANGKILEMNYPFDNVHHPIRNWEFHVTDDGDMLSKPPTRVVNILKYENLDQYEC
ncbi:unnamed protein product [Rotaria sp. Silwood1]|nr:unnamed protein product [Rotaria sp. Silwood1]